MIAKKMSAIRCLRRVVPLAVARHRTKWTPPPLPGAQKVGAAVDEAADRDAARRFVMERGYLPEVADAVVAALAAPEWGAGPGGLLALATRLAGRWEVGEDAGLGSLAGAVEREVAEASGRQRVSFKVTPVRGTTFTCEGFEGMSLKEVAEHGQGEGAALLGELLECACSGVMACSTCHVHVDSAWAEAVGPPTEEEEDMLDLAADRTEHSRLGCQLLLHPRLDGLIVRIPNGVNNLFDRARIGFGPARLRYYRLDLLSPWTSRLLKATLSTLALADIPFEGR